MGEVIGRVWSRAREFVLSFTRRDVSPSRLGKSGERLAARFLRRHGYRIIARNFRAAGAEVDIVAIAEGTLVFIEVKTRRTASHGSGAEAVNWRKQKRLQRAAEAFLKRPRMGSLPVRFDVVTITGSGWRRRAEIIRNAF